MDREITYQIIRSDRKTISIQVTHDGQVLVRCPRRMAEREVRTFVESKAAWIQRNLQKMQMVPEQQPFSLEEIQRLADQALTVIPGRVAHFAQLMGVDYGSITIRNQRSRWGSCSSKGNLNFNCLLMLVPSEVLDYVVVHELCHRKEMNHSPRFWAEVARVLPDYKTRQGWLKENGVALIRRLRG